MTDVNDNPTPVVTQQIALQILLSIGAQGQSILHPVKDTAEAIDLMRQIRKTPGFFSLGEGTNAPVMFHVRHVVTASIVLLEPTFKEPPPAPKIATLRH